MRWEAHGTEGLAGTFDKVVVSYTGGFRERIINYIANMVVPANKLTLVAGAVQEVHGVRREANPTYGCSNTIIHNHPHRRCRTQVISIGGRSCIRVE